MPKLSKIRLTGCRYAGLEKEHENSIFDLTKDDKADHSLFTLANGCGKGVMMQLIFQILLPEIRWGTNNGNKVLSMFYDQNSNLHSFTFHVVLEWILDTVPEKRLMTGIAVKAIIKNTSNEDEEKVGLSYFLYTNEYENQDYYSVEKLPIYDTDTREGVDLDIFENFIDNNKSFIKYSKSNVKKTDSDYYRYLESRGIYRSEWLNLRKINRLEGGSRDYFIGSGDNKSVFDKIIIPAISENIKNYSYDDSDNLIEMFRSNLSITKDLPILIKREGDYKELLAEIKPLIINANVGSGFIDIKERLIDEGNNINFILRDQYRFIEKEIEKWELESKKTGEEEKELKYRRDNLFYNQARIDLETREELIRDLDERLKEKSKELERKKEEEILYRINKSLHYKKDIENEIERKTLEKESLIEALDIIDTKERARYLDEEIESQWNKTKDIWVDVENQYRAYNNYNKGIKEANEDKKKKYLDRINSLEKEDNIFSIKEEIFQKDKKKLEEIYDPLSLVFPERISEDLIDSNSLLKEKVNSIDEEIKKHTEKTYSLDLDILKFENLLEKKNEDIKRLKERLIEGEKNEIEISIQLGQQLMENQEAGILSHNWFNKKLDQLEVLKVQKNSSLESIQRRIWEKSIDELLNKEDYFIPNKDIALIQEHIEKININVETGLEYLSGIDEKDKLELLANKPSFIYSLVIGSEKDWETIHKNIDKDLFINNMVPIYIRSQMRNHINDGFKVIENKAYDLVNKEEYISWKAEMEDELDSLIHTKDNIELDLSNIDSLIGKIKIINTKDTVLILTQKLSKLKKDISDIMEKIRLTREVKLEINNKLNSSSNILKEYRDKLEEGYKAIIEINEYIQNTKEIEKEREKILKIKEEINGLKREIINLDEAKDEISYNQESIRDSYYEWKAKVERIAEALKSLYKDAIYDYRSNDSYSNNKVPDFTIGADRLKSLLGERKIIDEDLSTKDTEIAVLATEIKNLGKDRGRYIEELESLSKDWVKYEYLELALDEINIRIYGSRKDIKKIEAEREKLKSRKDRIKGKIEILKEQLSHKKSSIVKTHKRAPLLLDIEDIDSEIDKVNRDIKGNKSYLNSCEEILKRNEKIKTKYEINLSEIKNGYPLEINKGKTNKILKDKLELNSDLIVNEWIRTCEKNKLNIKETIDDGENIKDRFTRVANSKLEEPRLREQIKNAVKDSNIYNFKSNIGTFNGMKKHFEMEILMFSDDKAKAEEAMKEWTNRAAMYVIKMIEALKDMVASMNYINEQGYAFPLVRLKGIERLPKEKSEIIYLLEEYFIQAIWEILEMDIDISNIEDRKLKDLMGDGAIFSKALQGRYPKLLVYKMSEKNEFKYARARDEHYTSWEAINKGEGDLPEGSGGQTLSVNTFVIMMIMSFKKRHIGNENPSTVLILDNPFGNASDKHVLDPIFEIADKLNFQLICLASPGIIKVEISERFPVFWELKIEEGKVVYGGRVIKADNP